MILEALTILGISIPFFGALIALYLQIWKPKEKGKTKHTKTGKESRLQINAWILLALFVLSLLIALGTYKLINHGKDKKESLSAYIHTSFEYERCPKYAVVDSKVYRASTGFNELTTDHAIVVSNTNDITSSILNIEVVIDQYQPVTPEYVLFFEPEGGFGDEDYDVFWGIMNPNQKKTVLKYLGRGPAEMTEEHVDDKNQTKYLKLEANSDFIIFPHVQFAVPGLYEFHYVINYNLNGEKKSKVLSSQKMYVTDLDSAVMIPYHYTKLQEKMDKLADTGSKMDKDTASSLNDVVISLINEYYY